MPPNGVPLDRRDGAVGIEADHSQRNTYLVGWSAIDRERLADDLAPAHPLRRLGEDPCALLRRDESRGRGVSAYDAEAIALANDPVLAALFGPAVGDHHRVGLGLTLVVTQGERYAVVANGRTVGPTTVVGRLSGVDDCRRLGHDDLAPKPVDSHAGRDAHARVVGGGDDIEPAE